MLLGSAEQRSAVIIIKFDSHLNANDAEANTVGLTIFQFQNLIFHCYFGFEIWSYLHFIIQFSIYLINEEIRTSLQLYIHSKTLLHYSLTQLNKKIL